jgi:hypothetical protein
MLDEWGRKVKSAVYFTSSTPNCLPITMYSFMILRFVPTITVHEANQSPEKGQHPVAMGYNFKKF